MLNQIVTAVFVIATITLISFIYYILEDKWEYYVLKRRIKKLLEGRDLQRVLDEAPYEYGLHSQGDNGLWIAHKLTGEYVEIISGKYWKLKSQIRILELSIIDLGT